MLHKVISTITIWFKGTWNTLASAITGIKLLPVIRRNQVTLILDTFTKKDLSIIAAAAIIFLATGGFLMAGTFERGSGTEPHEGGEHIEGLVGQPRFINPVLAGASSVDTDLSKIIFAQLIKFDHDLNLIADLAQSLPEVSADQKIYILKLKPDLKWQDGKPLRADDVLFTVNVIQNPEFESPLRTNWSRVKVEKIDDLTVKFTLREVSASFMINFTLGILPKHIWEGSSANSFRLSDNNLKAVGSGPFIIREIKKTPEGMIKSLVLRANDLYYAGRPYLDKLTFKFYDDYEGQVNGYQSKAITSVGYVPFDTKAFIDSSAKHNQTRINLPQYQAVFFNLQKTSLFSDKAVRQAMWLATDRQPIVDEVYQGLAKPSYGPILEGNLGYNEEVKKLTHTDLNEAIGILEKGGWVIDPATNVRVKNKKRLEFNLVTNSFVSNLKTAQVLKNQWEKTGAQINIVIVSAADLEQQYIRTRSFDALLFSENTGADPDPYSFWHSSQSRDPGLNLSSFSHSTVDSLLTAARQTNDTNVRAKNYQQFQLIITNEIPAIFLDSAVYAYNTPKKLKGINLETIIHPSERFLDIKNWYINTR